MRTNVRFKTDTLSARLHGAQSENMSIIPNIVFIGRGQKRDSIRHASIRDVCVCRACCNEHILYVKMSICHLRIGRTEQ